MRVHGNLPVSALKVFFKDEATGFLAIDKLHQVYQRPVNVDGKVGLSIHLARFRR